MASEVKRPGPLLSTMQGVLGQGLPGGLACALLLTTALAILAPAEILRAAAPAHTVLRLFLLGPAFAVAALALLALLLWGLSLGRVRVEALRHLLRLFTLCAVLAPPLYSLLLFTFWNGRAHWPLLACSALLLPLLVRLCDELARRPILQALETPRAVALALLLVAGVGIGFAATGEPEGKAAGIEREPGAVLADRPAAAQPGLVLLLTIDTLRADHLSAYGYPRETSPAIDKLAAEGLRFERVIAASSGSMPALATLISGESPRRHGVVDQRGRLGAASTTLAERFSAAGFATVGVVVNPLVGERSGLQQGFDRFERLTGAPAPTATARLLELLPERAEVPTFAWLHLYEPHTPYEPDPALTSDFLDDEFYDGRKLRAIDYGSYDGIRIARTLGRRRTGGPRDRQAGYADALYDGEILAADQAIGILLAELELRYAANETVILFSADHGEILAPTAGRLFYQHALEVYQPALEVPAILWAPGRVAPASLHQALACQEDLAPTLLTVSGLAGPGEELSGIDLLAEDSPPHACISQTAWWDDLSLRAVGRPRRTPTYALVEGHWKLIARLRSDLDQIRDPLAWLAAWRSSMVGFWRGDELYRLDSDPGELVNLIESEPQRAASLRGRLEATLGRN